MNPSDNPPGTPPLSCPAYDRIPLYGPEFAADPAEVYAKLRRYGPLGPVELAPGVPATLVTSYEVAVQVLSNPHTFPRDARRWQANIPANCPVLPLMMYAPHPMFTDGALHARLREAVTDSLARVDPNALRGYIEDSADLLIDRMAPTGHADLLTQYARILPLQVINQMFGCPPELGDRFVQCISGIYEGREPKRFYALFVQSLGELVTLKRRQPSHDVTSWLMAHPAQLTDEEMVHNIGLIVAGVLEPEVNLIGNALRLLLADDRFAGNLTGGSLPVQDAIDEVLWTDTPLANLGITYPVRDLDFAGVRLPANQPVVISFAAANADPSLIGKQRTGNRAHLAFGLGPHACPTPGKSQARLIAAVAIEKLLDALPDLTLAVPAQELTWRPGPFHRSLTALPVRFPPVPLRHPGDSRQLSGPVSAEPTQPAPAPTPKSRPLLSRAARRGWNSVVSWWHGQ